MAQTRREFLSNTACGALAGTALLRGMNKMFLVNALAKPNDFTDYKALVCVFLFGGNDANNIVIPYTNYADYDAIRGGSVNLGIPQDLLLQINPPSDGRTYGLHPSLGDVTDPTRGLYGLWNQNKVAIAVNTGTLIRPLTRAEYLANIGRPYQLFSHSDQQTSWQTSISGGHASSGWGGRLADRVRGSQSFPVITSIAGVQIFNSGFLTRPLIIGAAPTRLDQVLQVTRNYPEIGQLVSLEQADGSRTLVQTSATLVNDALTTADTLRTLGDPTLTTVFPGTGLGNQLKQVAKVIKLAPAITGVQRQIFIVQMGGFDTHTNQGQQTGTQATLWTQVSDAITAFYNATVELGVSNQVTTFTMSDFSRTLKPANPGANVGTDHAWGSHHFVVGDAVLGGDFYGTFPSFNLGTDDDVDTGSGARGRFLPTQSVDQFAATMALWYGLDPAELGIVFPNIDNYATADLRFMSAGTSPIAAAGQKSFLQRALGL